MNQFGFEFKIALADVGFKIHADFAMELEAGYVPFLVENNTETDIDVHCFNKLPAFDLTNFKLAFEAKNETQQFYAIYITETEWCYVIYNQKTINQIQQIAFINRDFTRWKIYATDNLPLKYPMGPIIMHCLTLYTDALLIHASCTFDGKKSRLFTGVSGVGKSTMSRIWSEAGAQIINDDRLLIRKIDNEFFVYNTPMQYVDFSKKAPLHAIYLIRHASQNRLNRVKGAFAISKVIAHCIQNNFDKALINKRIDLVAEMCACTPVYELGFVPTHEVVRYITANETKQ